MALFAIIQRFIAIAEWEENGCHGSGMGVVSRDIGPLRQGQYIGRFNVYVMENNLILHYETLDIADSYDQRRVRDDADEWEKQSQTIRVPIPIHAILGILESVIGGNNEDIRGFPGCKRMRI